MKRIGYLERKKMIEAQRAGASNTDLKRRFTIKDNRTLFRHLQTAQQEEQLRAVQVEIIKDAITEHHNDVRKLIQQWMANMRTLRPDEIYPVVVIPNRELEEDPIFNHLKEHIPSKTLWANYAAYEKMVQELFGRCLELRKEVAKKVMTWSGVERVTDNVAQPILRMIAEAESINSLRPFAFKLSSPGKTPDETIIRAEGIEVLAIKSQTDAKSVEKQYQDYSYKLIKSETGERISAIFHELKDELEPKIKEQLQEILHRRDYIMNTCRLCPGQPKLLRK